VLFNCDEAQSIVDMHRIEQNGFRLIEQVEETSRTVAWKAVQETLDRTVIIKALKTEVSGIAAEVHRFLATARHFARIKSDSIAAVFDIVSDGDLHYVVMEHVEGPTLTEWVTQHGPMEQDRILRIASSLVVSIDQMWVSARIVHRNLKSTTIRLDNRGIAKITDFTLAIEAGPGVDALAMDDGNIVGTPCYLSPEQAQGAHTLTTQSDMYALGVVLYYLATGQTPFETLDVVSILTAHIQQSVPPPHRINRNVSVDFSWFLNRLMMKAPEDRYADWDAVLHDIRNLLSDTTPSCANPDEAFPSTIRMSADDLATDKSRSPHGSRARGGTKRKVKRVAMRTSARGTQGPAAAPAPAEHKSSRTFYWSFLVCWLLLVFWYRAVYQAEPAQASVPAAANSSVVVLSAESKTTLGAAAPNAPVIRPKAIAPKHKPAPADLPATPKPEATVPRNVEPETAAAPAPQPTAAPLPEGIPADLATGLATAFSKGDLATARKLVRASQERFKEKEQLESLMERIPSPDALVVDYLKKQIGKPLVFQHNGKERSVVARGVENGMIHLEANGRGVELPIEKLSADEKLRWMERPEDPAQSAAYCLVLLGSSRRDEVSARAAACPLLADVFAKAAELPAPVKTPAE
jgi:serine/threonine protein kinase